jgi:hypothetical protein
MKILMFVYVKARRFVQGWIGDSYRRERKRVEMGLSTLGHRKILECRPIRTSHKHSQNGQKTSGITPMFEIVILYMEFVMYRSIELMEMTMSFSTQFD